MQRSARAWHADSWGDMDGASATTIEDAVSILDHLYGAAEGFHEARRRLLDGAHVRGGTHLLELGCGTMPQLAETAALVGTGGKIVGLDNSESLLHVARERARTLDIANVEFRQGDCRELPFDAACFDAVLADKLLIHVGPGEAIVSEMLRVT